MMILALGLSSLSSKNVFMDSSLALSMKPQVLTSIRSAFCASSVSIQPSLPRLQERTSASTWFLAQPRFSIYRLRPLLLRFSF